jgi:hypothetical protein
LRIARGKFSQLKEQARENILATQNNLAGAAFLNSGKLLTPVNTTQALADELKTSKDTAGRIIQIQAKADEPTKENILAAQNNLTGAARADAFCVHYRNFACFVVNK